jgi:hypothetical protein
MRPALEEASLVEHINQVRLLNRAQPMRYHHHRFSSQDCFEVVLQCPLCGAVELRGRFVKDHELRRPDQDPCDRQPLSLTAREGSCIDNVRLIPIGPKHGMISPLTIYMEG